MAALVWAWSAWTGKSGKTGGGAEPPRTSEARLPAAPPPVPAAAGKPSVAALPFTNAHKDPKWAQFEQGIADAFAGSFARDGRFRVVERSQLDKALEELKLNRSEAVDPSTAQRVGRLIGARYLIVGSFQVFEGQMRLNARMIRVETGEIVQAQTAAGEAKDGLALPDRAAQQFLKAVKPE
jgi:TolB-like protein